MTIAVFGVTGHTGRAAADALLAAGKSVRVVVRDEAKGEAFRKRGAEVRVADLASRAQVAEALKGASAAYLLIPPNFAAPDFHAYQRALADSICGALQDAEVPQAVFLSSIGAQVKAGTGPIVGLNYAEAQLRAMPATRVVLLRPAYFMENLGGSLGALEQGVFPTFMPADLAIDMVAAADIGKAAAALLLEGVAATEVVQLTGGKYSANDTARALSRLLKKPVAVAEAPVSGMASALSEMGLPAQMAGLYQEMTEALIAGRLEPEPQLRKLKGSTGLEQVLATLLGR